ncbi:MAG TPA: hypothetical protein VFN90_01380 [Gemmatimonadales bacterium]|nr:hypothetical protein [Gemmatimonadales bacterium]
MPALLVAACAALLLLPMAELSAQSATLRPRPAGLVQPVTAHRLRMMSTPHSSHTLVVPMGAPSRRANRRTGTSLMLVGLAGILTGLIVDEPVITIAGAGVGGLGLYYYVR